MRAPPEKDKNRKNRGQMWSDVLGLSEEETSLMVTTAITWLGSIANWNWKSASSCRSPHHKLEICNRIIEIRACLRLCLCAQGLKAVITSAGQRSPNPNVS
eukprot:c3898_g1_i1.p2 GENE.c3898_g1_i1~~c3898_g1_i1.p2  ORF type:complete len:101 (+),score=24.22 c3898_g1_i1:316-618(+)